MIVIMVINGAAADGAVGDKCVDDVDDENKDAMDRNKTEMEETWACEAVMVER